MENVYFFLSGDGDGVGGCPPGPYSNHNLALASSPLPEAHGDIIQ